MTAWLREGVRTGVFPGCVALVWCGKVLYEGAHGHIASAPWGERLAEVGPSACADSGADTASAAFGPIPEVTPATIFDLASLTKVLATTTLAARVLEAGLVDLDTSVPQPWGQACPGATLRDLLEHASGLPAHCEYFARVESPATTGYAFDHGADAVLEAVSNTDPEYAPRARAVYSDLGFMILGAWLERLLGQPLERAFDESVAEPLGLTGELLAGAPDREPLGFRRLRSRSDIEPGPSRIAPTEVYAALLHDEEPSYFPVRREVALARGVVHDDNAYVMGGVAGHAGLFGTARAVLEVASAWLDPRKLGFSECLRDEFWRPSTVPGSTRRLGFDGPEPDGSGSSGSALSPRAVGHTGFTGTSLWIDPTPHGSPGAPLIAILLSNRVHPTRANDKIRGFRPRFHELAAALAG